MRILLIDNNDSFTRNLEHLLAAATSGRVSIAPYADLGKLDKTRMDEFDFLVISPGPGRPSDYPDYTRFLETSLPVLGICLGMQIINEYFGGTTERLEGCVHGRAEAIEWQGRQAEVARYHSLRVAQLGQGLDILAANRDKTPMALVHRERKMLGFQFHPESFMTPDGAGFIHYALDFFQIA